MKTRSRLHALLAVAALFVAACGDDDEALDQDLGQDTTTTEDETTTTGNETATTATTPTTPEQTTTSEQAAPEIEGPVNDQGTAAITGSSVPVDMSDFAFDPTFLTNATGTVTVQLENTGGVAHTFTIESRGIDEVLEPGQQAEVAVELTTGEDPTVFICRFHVAQGMKGAFASS